MTPDESNTGWGSDLHQTPTGYWLCWQDGLKGQAPRFEASTEEEARAQYKAQYGYDPDHCEKEFSAWGN